jgi:hypothetical protein
VFDPATMEAVHRGGNDVPAWFLDTDYNGLCFHVTQAFFPRTAAWDDLKRALKGEYEDSVWEHLAGTVSAPFEAGEHGQIAVKVIDDRGNELMVVKDLKGAESSSAASSGLMRWSSFCRTTSSWPARTTPARPPCCKRSPRGAWLSTAGRN